jgi:hypothetical protein
MHDFEPSTKHFIFSYATEVENQLFKDLLNGFVVLCSHLKNMYLDVSQTFYMLPFLKPDFTLLPISYSITKKIL